ncbi:TauD/TfdA dioxygenase family protein [Sphingobium yanoikuyae]|uniref:TauD/TfdA dioxygenase family protein n=1 Tax=Sphingobium yanoikuyae TaxID=13690 RepID=UPI001F34AAF9|nr:TauD/TfdA family dioxygenase [Sphingobium yanoikuyae]
MLSDADYVRFASFFGRPLESFIRDHRNADYPEINHSKSGPATPLLVRDGAVHWHWASSHEVEGGAVTMLLGKKAPDVGGETRFARTSKVYESLSDKMKHWSDGLVARHGLGRAPWIEGETEPDPDRPRRQTDAPDHPLVMAHPVTGRKGIFTSGTAYGIHGMDDAEEIALIRELREHIVRSEHRISCKVRAGDIVLWDHFDAVHGATPTEYSSEQGAVCCTGSAPRACQPSTSRVSE